MARSKSQPDGRFRVTGRGEDIKAVSEGAAINRAQRLAENLDREGHYFVEEWGARIWRIARKEDGAVITTRAAA